MSPLLSFRTSSRRPPAAEPTTGWRQEVCPPALWAAAPKALPAWRRWLAWSPGKRRGATQGRPGSVAEAREEFAAVLADIGTQHAEFLQHRLRRVRSMRELWYLRSEMFGLVALHHSEAEAERRLGVLNRHFPTRTPRSIALPLNA
jgi:hypothetical protein